VRENRLNFPELPDRDTTELVGLNESTQLEFKSTFQWDMKESRKNERLRIEAIKTIAAFNNTNGGYLLIGVTDKKKICGIDKDLALLSRKDVDGFSQLLIQEIENEIDRSFATKPIITFPMIEDKQICLIKINPGQEATWVIVNGKSTFYIRTMNSTRELDPKKASEYILKKWGR
jgi:predicted HTH transcriptional regulator